MEDYLNRGVDVNGKPKARQGHMELAYELGLQVNIGDIIYYVNGGTAKSHGFVDRHKKGANKGELNNFQTLRATTMCQKQLMHLTSGYKFC